MKKIVLSLLFIFALFVPVTSVQAKTVNQTGYSKVTNIKTPVSRDQVTKVQSLATGYGQDPVIYGDYLYTLNTDFSLPMPQLLKINKETMKEVASVDLIGKTGYTPFIEAGNGQIFVPLSDGRIQAFDAQTMESTWVSEKPKQVDNVASRLTYYDGYLYYGVGGYNAKAGDPFLCINTEDKDKNNKSEINKIVWTYSGGQGYYWSEAVITENAIAFSGYDGKVVLHDLKTDKVYDTVDLKIGGITNSLFYDQVNKKIIAANKDGYVATVNLKNNAFEKESLNTVKFNGQFSSSPLVYNNRIYIAGGTKMGASHSTFTVLDLNTLKVIYKIDDIYGQCIPILSTSYARDDNHNEVQLYMINYSYDAHKQTHLYHIVDNGDNHSPIYETLYTIDEPLASNYWNGSLVMDHDAFYAYNGNGIVVKFGFDTSIQTIKDEEVIVSELNNQIKKLPHKDNVSIELEAQLKDLKSKYSMLSQESQKKVNQFEIVTELEKIIQKQKQLIEELDDDIINQLNIYDLSIKDEKLVDEFIERYQQIHKDNQKYVENIKDVFEAKKQINELKQNNSHFYPNNENSAVQTYDITTIMPFGVLMGLSFIGMYLLKKENV